MEIQSLTISERIMLAEALWDSIVAEDSKIKLTETQKDELDRRLAAFEIDQDVGSSWSSVKARILSK
ncbi:MAG: addiction module protein [Candidatus Thiodiazotropha sp. (ex Dulcina madagascariensis)]|nr:addiction module protein [Candidatus Thiodiazotropha sp. (ex Dulcina madagascariensis)]